MSVTVEIPEQAEVSFKFEISAKANHKPKALVSEANITPFVAKQSIDDFLLNSVGNLLCAGEPEFFVKWYILESSYALYNSVKRNIGNCRFPFGGHANRGNCTNYQRFRGNQIQCRNAL